MDSLTPQPEPRSTDTIRLSENHRFDDLITAIRMSWDEVFDLPEPRPLSQNVA